MRSVLAAVAAALAVGGAAAAHADGLGDTICQLLAAGNSPEDVAGSTAVQNSVSGGLDHSAAMVLVRSTAAAQCPQFLWRF